MGERGVSEITTQVHRPPATKTWSVKHRWGQLHGDTVTLAVTRTAEGRLFLAYGQDSLEIPNNLVNAFVEMVNEADCWTDEEKSDG